MGPSPVGGNGGSSPAPSGGSGNAGAPAQAEHCSPNEGIALPLGPSCLFDTEPEDLGITDDPRYLDVSSVELEVPMVAGQPYAFSFEAQQVRGTFGGYVFEIWGATEHTFDDGSRCGVATELVGSIEVPTEGVYCMDLVATQDHQYWLKVLRAGSYFGGDGSLQSDLNYCPMATCP